MQSFVTLINEYILLVGYRLCKSGRAERVNNL